MKRRGRARERGWRKGVRRSLNIIVIFVYIEIHVRAGGRGREGEVSTLSCEFHAMSQMIEMQTGDVGEKRLAVVAGYFWS
jgi:hypothetical protein